MSTTIKTSSKKQLDRTCQFCRFFDYDLGNIVFLQNCK